MKRKICAMLLALVVMLTASVSGMAAGGLPPFTAEDLMDDDKVRDLLDAYDVKLYQPDMTIPSDKMVEFYDKLQNKNKSMYALNFKAGESYSDALASDFSDYLADYTFSLNKDAHVIFIGHYQGFPLLGAMMEIKANQKYRVLETMGMKFTYPDIVNMVGTDGFSCMAIVVTQDVKNALAETSIVTRGELDMIPTADADTGVGLDLRLYEVTDHQNDPYGNTSQTVVVSRNPFNGYRDPELQGSGSNDSYYDYVDELIQDKPVPAVSLPQTGDASNPALWLCLCAAALSGMLLMMKKRQTNG